MSEPRYEVFNHHSSEEPVVHSARNTLQDVAVKRQHIERTNAPTEVVTVLPVVHAVLPPTLIAAPPLARDVVVLESPLRGARRVRVSTLVVYALGSQSEVYNASQSDTANDERSTRIVQRRGPLGSEIYAVSGVVAASHVPHSGPLAVISDPSAALCDARTGAGVSAMKQRQRRHHRVYRRPYNALYERKRAMPQRIFDDSPRQPHHPLHRVVGSFAVVAGHDDLEYVVHCFESAMHHDVVVEGIDKP